MRSDERVRTETQSTNSWKGPQQAEAFVRKLFDLKELSAVRDRWVWMRTPTGHVGGVPVGLWNLVRNVRD